MTKKLKKSLATMLAMSMILSVVSISAFAAGEDENENDIIPAVTEEQFEEKEVEIPETPEIEENNEEEPESIPAIELTPATLAEPAEEELDIAPVALDDETPVNEEPDVSGAKFGVVISSRLNDGSITYVYGTVDADYQAKLVLPGPANGEGGELAEVNAGNATIKVVMNDVASLGGGHKTFEKTIHTGVENVQTTIANNATNLYKFGGTTINAVIKFNGEEKAVTYSISEAHPEEGNTVITGTANEEAARAAWQLMTQNIAAGSKPQDDSFIVIAPNSWLQIGDEVLVFEEGRTESLKLDNITAENLGNLNAEIRQAVKLVNADESGLAFCLGQGTQLALSNSSAELTEDVVVTVGGVDMTGLQGLLGDLRDGAFTGGKNMILSLLGLMNTALEAVKDKELNVTIEFGEEPEEPVELPKFKVEVSSMLSNGTVTTVTGTVDQDYNAKLVIPNAAVNAGNVTIKVEMNDVASLGGGNKSHEMTLGTGVDAQGNLFDALNGLGANALKNFDSATVNATIISGGETAEVTYTLEGSQWQDDCEAKVITGTPSEGVRDAWHLMVNEDNFNIGTQTDDSKIIIANGSSLQIGTELLEFEDGYTDDLVLDNFANMSVTDITNAVKLTTVEESALTFTLKKGTTLAVSSSYAALAKDVTVTMTGVEVPTGILSGIRDAVNDPEANATAIIKGLLDLMDQAIAMVDSQDVNVTIEFACEHTYGEPVWTWTGTTAATATFTCETCGDEQTVEATITSATSGRTTTYTAAVEFEGETYTDTTSVTAPAPSTGGGTTTTTPEEDLGDGDTPLADRPFLFEDVAETDWFYEAVKNVFDLGLMKGVGETSFDPYTRTTRGSVAMILYRLEGEPEVEGEALPDVAETAFYRNASIWACQSGVYTGYDNGNFGGDDLVTREQLVTVLYRYIKMKELDATESTELTAYADASEVGDWAEEAMRWAVAIGLVEGRGEGEQSAKLAPQSNAMRVELATILNRLVEKYPTIVPAAETEAE